VDNLTQAELLAKHIDTTSPDAASDGPSLDESGTPLWVIISYARAVDWDVALVADTYGVTEEAVRAAFGYYAQHAKLIDAQIVVNSEIFA
jgi:uncharacterized protein (DUF433 family)